jgi:phosphohistidine phosphatase
MKMLYLIRHAKSSWDYPELKDFDRPLGARGLRDAPFMAKMIRDEGVVPDKLVSSPAKRAHSTAIFFAQAQGIRPEDIEQELAVYHAYSEDILRIARHWPDEWNTVFLFGHNPTFTSVANFFTESYIDNVPTCGIVAIELAASKWSELKKGAGKVKEFWYPKQFKQRK